MELKKTEVLLGDDVPEVLGNEPRFSVYDGKMYGHDVFTFVPFYQNNNLHHGPFLFRHKGKRKKGKPNYPPTKLIVKTARRWSKSQRGWRKLARQEGWFGPRQLDSRQLRAAARNTGKTSLVKVQLQSCPMFTGKGPVGHITAKSESILRESQS